MARLLSMSEVKKLLTMKDFVEILDKTYRDMGEGRVVNPAKGTLDLGESGLYPPYRADINSMPAYVGWVDAAGIKWAGGWMNNPNLGLPYVSAVIVMVNPKNGVFTGVLDGTFITNMRTGAQTAVAFNIFSRRKNQFHWGSSGRALRGGLKLWPYPNSLLLMNSGSTISFPRPPGSSLWKWRSLLAER